MFGSLQKVFMIIFISIYLIFGVSEFKKTMDNANQKKKLPFFRTQTSYENSQNPKISLIVFKVFKIITIEKNTI
jgi:hypothetical protein